MSLILFTKLSKILIFQVFLIFYRKHNINTNYFYRQRGALIIYIITKPRSANNMLDLSSRNETYYLHKRGTFAFFYNSVPKDHILMLKVHFNDLKTKVFEFLLPKP